MRVKIKSWDELVSEFGTCKHSDNKINTPGNYWFIKPFYDKLPTNRVVEIEDHSERDGEKYITIKNITGYIANKRIIECIVSDSYRKKSPIPIFIWIGLGAVGIYIYNKLK